MGCSSSSSAAAVPTREPDPLPELPSNGGAVELVYELSDEELGKGGFSVVVISIFSSPLPNDA